MRPVNMYQWSYYSRPHSQDSNGYPAAWKGNDGLSPGLERCEEYEWIAGKSS